jgi:ribonuclease P protein component
MHVVPRVANVWLSNLDYSGWWRIKRNLTDDELADSTVGSDVSCAVPSGSQDFARKRRIVKTDEFSSVFRLRPVERTAHFVLYARPNTLGHARLGVVAAKRFAPRAVTRNTVKRLTREIFRMATLPAIDYVVRLSGPVNSKQGPATNGALKALVRAELLRLFGRQVPR